MRAWAQVCAHDIEEVCVYERDSLDNIEGFDARVITCLQVCPSLHVGLSHEMFLGTCQIACRPPGILCTPSLLMEGPVNLSACLQLLPCAYCAPGIWQVQNKGLMQQQVINYRCLTCKNTG